MGLVQGLSWLSHRRLLLGALLAWIAFAAIGLSVSRPLGHDEAAFSTIARGNVPETWAIYRSEGTVALARLGVWLGGDEWQLRLASAVISVLMVVAVYAVGKAAGSPRGGAWAAALVAGAQPMVLRSSELLGDLPAAAAIMLGMAVLVTELERPTGPRWRLLAAAPCFAAAFYLRYGSAPMIAFAGLLAVTLWWRTALAHPLRLAALAATMALLLVPHLWLSHQLTGELLGILRHSAGVPRRAYVGEGLVTYLTSNPFLYYGFMLAPVMGLGLLRLPWLRRRAPLYLGLVALGQLIALGLQSHGQPRYVYLATALFTALGAEALVSSRWASRWARPGLATSLAFVAIVAGWVSAGVITTLSLRGMLRTREPIREAAAAIRADAGAGRCAIAAPDIPQLVWYSGCTAGIYEPPRDPAVPPSEPHYVVWLAARQHADVQARLREGQPGGPLVPLASSPGRFEVWRAP